jgi:hypothetical protein
MSPLEPFSSTFSPKTFRNTTSDNLRFKGLQDVHGVSQIDGFLYLKNMTINEIYEMSVVLQNAINIDLIHPSRKSETLLEVWHPCHPKIHLRRWDI